MKITKELEAKIARQINEKYKNETDKLEEERKVIRDQEVEKAIAEVEYAISACQSVKRFIKRQMYNKQKVSEYVANNSTFFIDNAVYGEIDKNLEKIRKQKQLEIERLTIAISYEKDIDGIKKAFDETGLKF